MRNIAVHSYDDVDLVLVWRIATAQAQELVDALTHLGSGSG
jgi:uncharacterized protein with HEPN domain